MNINILKTLMKKENISMYRLSKLSGIENKSIWNIVNNKRKDPQISTIVKIAKALNLNEREFAELCGYRKDEEDEVKR
ncbi:helix-turn-helix domain-containing protein [Faecalibacillus faecis]|uniref:helix-turn-helix domain-containing protein n=1 Tax=Faecalibacillus faecis TaxID=1982628 RepID=UPI00386F5268